MAPQKVDEAITKFHKIVRERRAFKGVLEASGIDLKKQSPKNILDTYERLRTGQDLSAGLRATINAEKIKPSDVLTPEELTFFSALLKDAWLANHATTHATEIQNSEGYVYSTKELARRKIQVQSHTGNMYGENDFVFLSYTYPQKIDSVNFVSSGDIFTVDLDAFAQKDKVAFSGIWTSGHFFAYDTQQLCKPICYKFNNERTKVFTQYAVDFVPIIAHMRTLTYHSSTGVESQCLRREQEISVGRHIKPFHLLRLIEHLRFINAETRHYILKNYANKPLMAEVFGSLFTPGKAELHVPAALQFSTQDPDVFNFIPWHDLSYFDSELLDYFKKNDYLNFKKCLRKNPGILFYRCRRARYDELSLLNLVVLDNRPRMLRLLMKLGFNPDHAYINESQGMLHYATRYALQDAIELNSMELVKILVESASSRRRVFSTFYCASVRDVDLYTAIAFNCDLAIFTYLLAKYQENDTNITPFLSVATYYQNSAAMEALLAAGADPNATQQIYQDANLCHLYPLSFVDNHTALSLAAKHGLVAALDVLLKHGAETDAFIKTAGVYEKFGKGQTALQVAVSSLTNYRPCSRRSSQDKYETCACRFDNLPQATVEDYLKIIEMLLQAGASPYFTNGRGYQVYRILKKQLDSIEKGSEALKELFASIPYDQAKIAPVPTAMSQSFDHYSYALITGHDRQGVRQLVLGEEENYHIPLSYCAPGGRVDYVNDSNCVDTAIKVTAYQTNLNLHGVRKKSPSYILEDNEEEQLITTHHFQLSGAIEDYDLFKNTPDSTFYRGAELGNTTKLKNIRCIPIDAIEIKNEKYKEIDYPVCTYQGRTLPLFLAPKIAALCGNKRYLNEKARALALSLYFSGYTEIEESIKQGDTKALRALLKLGLKEHVDMARYIVTTFQANQRKLLQILLRRGIRMEADGFGHFCAYKLSDTNPSEALVLTLWRAHKKLVVKNYYIENIAIYAGHKGFIDLSLELIHADRKYLPHCAKGAIEKGNDELLQTIFLSISLEERVTLSNKLICEFSSTISFNNLSSEERIPYLKVLKIILTNYQAIETCDYVLARLGSIYELLVTKEVDNPELLDLCLTAIYKAINTIHFQRNDEQIYYVYSRLIYSAQFASKKHKDDRASYYSRAAQLLLDQLLTRPVYQLLHAVEQNNSALLDSLLVEHHDNLELQQLAHASTAIDFDKEDDNRDTCLQRAVKRNDVDTVFWLLSHFYSYHKDKNLEQLDKAANSPLKNARVLGFTQIANLLLVHGALDIDLKYLRALNSSKKLVNFVPEKGNVMPQKALAGSEVYLVTESPGADYNKGQTGDVDYAKNIALYLREQYQLTVTCVHNDSRVILDGAMAKGGTKPIVHLLLNAPHTGFALDIAYLSKLKASGIKLVITVLEFAKHLEAKLKKQTLDHLNLADQVIFLDENDKQDALETAMVSHPLLSTKIESASVLVVPPTISPAYISQEKNAADIMVFGMIRAGKGMAHVLQLANIMKESPEKSLRSKEIMIVGSVSKHKTRNQETAYDATLYTLLAAIYPQCAAGFYGKSPEELITLYNSIKKDEKAALPISLHLDVEEKDLPNLFARCKYAFYPAYRGATLRNSSISTELAFGCVLYSHVDKTITPVCLQKNGVYRQAMVLMDSDAYATYATNVAADIVLREKNDLQCHGHYTNHVSMNDVTREHANKLLENEMSAKSIADKHLAVYSSLLEAAQVADVKVTQTGLDFFAVSSVDRDGDNGNHAAARLRTSMCANVLKRP